MKTCRISNGLGIFLSIIVSSHMLWWVYGGKEKNNETNERTRKNGATTLSCHAAACRKDKQCIYMIYVKVNWEINILTLKSITDNICHFIIPVIVRRLE